jgi:hypothetical protein
MNRKYFIFIISLAALICIGFLSENVYSLGHYKSMGGTGGTVANCNVCHDFVNGRYQNPDATHNLRWVKTTIKVCSTSTDIACNVDGDCPTGESCTTVGTVKFDRFSKDDSPAQTPPYDGTLADGNNALLDGACEVCHHPIELFTDENSNSRWDPGEPSTDLNGNGLCDPGESYVDVDHNGKCDPGTKYHYSYNYAPYGDTTNHHDGENCTGCHPHFLDDINNYFEPRFPGNQSHYTHFTDPKGPKLGDSNCTYCHYSNSVLDLFKDGKPLSETEVCDTCHGKGGDYELNGYGSIADAKANWEVGIYEPPLASGDWPSKLREGQEFWCLNCHDNSPAVIDTPSTPNTDPVTAPNVAGDSTKNYSYFSSGHGHASPPVSCSGVPGVNGCHYTLFPHIDGKARTYVASSDNYQSGYRLSANMSIPRNTELGSGAFELCVSCHSWTKLISDVSNFRDINTGKQLHDLHLGTGSIVFNSWDSDWDSSDYDEDCFYGTCGDSKVSCTACHNVHGSPMYGGAGGLVPCPPMIRHGELISSPGTNNKVPAFSFRWLDEHGVETADFNNSLYGYMICGGPDDISLNHVCWGCHETQNLQYKRVPETAEAVTIHEVKTTDTDGNPYPTCTGTDNNTFHKGAPIRYHVSFTITGPAASYYVVARGTVQKAIGTGPQQTFQAAQTLTPGNTYHWCWDKQLPSSVNTPLDVKVTFEVGMFDTPGGTLKQLDLKGHLFNIVE